MQERRRILEASTKEEERQRTRQQERQRKKMLSLQPMSQRTSLVQRQFMAQQLQRRVLSTKTLEGLSKQQGVGGDREDREAGEDHQVLT